MADGVQIDSSALDKLAADLGSVPAGAGRRIRQAVEVGARNVKDEWRDSLKGASHLPQGSRSISYDIDGVAALTGSEITAEVGPVLGGQGSIVGLVEVGTPTLPPRNYGASALRNEIPDFEKGVEKAIDDALRAVGL